MKKTIQTAKYILADFLSASVVWILFNLLRYHEVASHLRFESVSSYLSHTKAWEGQILIPGFWIVLYYFSGYYNKPFSKSRIAEFFLTLSTVWIGVTLLFFIIVLNDIPHSIYVYYELYFSLLLLQFICTYLPRLIITQAGIRKTKERKWVMHVLIIGTGKKARLVAENLFQLGYQVTGFISEDKQGDRQVEEHLIRGYLADLPDIMETEQVDELIVAIESAESQQVLSILYTLYPYKRPIKVLYVDKMLLFSRVKINNMYGIPLIDLTDNNFSEAGKNLKVFLDKILSLFIMAGLSPLFIYVVVRIKKDSPGPVLFKQERIGYLGKPFFIYKFRTMYVDAEKDTPMLSSENDPRITPFGRIMRKYRLDELPQFWNVLKGDMAIVGPRPERKYYIDQIVKKAPYYYLLHNVRPGITSLGMVKYGYAGNVEEMVKRLEYDMLYYENMSLLLDLKILVFTIQTVLTGKGI